MSVNQIVTIVSTLPLMWFDSLEERDKAVADLAALPPACRRALATLVETQGKEYSRETPTLTLLYDLGFILVSDLDGIFGTRVRATPTLWGEEALEAWESSSSSSGRPAGTARSA